MFNFIKNISPVEIIIILVILFFFFGAKTMAKLGKAGGETVKEIKNIKKEFNDAVNLEDEPEEKK
jgi:TatA/E family protein of Tat protein translocase